MYVLYLNFKDMQDLKYSYFLLRKPVFARPFLLKPRELP